MTLMDAPKYDAAKARRRTQIFSGIFGALAVFIVFMWFFTGRPVDWPWTWWMYWAGERDVNQFLQAVESNDMARAYGIWNNDFDWQRHPDKYVHPTYERFKQFWGQNSSDNDYGTILSHRVVARKKAGEGLIVGMMINGRKSAPLFLIYDGKSHTLDDSPFELTIPEQ